MYGISLLEKMDIQWCMMYDFIYISILSYIGCLTLDFMTYIFFLMWFICYFQSYYCIGVSVLRFLRTVKLIPYISLFFLEL